jgi:hypothetical protein
MKATLPHPICNEKPNEGVTACRLCGDSSEAAQEWIYRYGHAVPGADVCSPCAVRIVNAFSMEHSGAWATYPNQPIESPSKKARVTQGLRMAVFERDEFRCKHCGTQKSLSIDHVHPESKGGPTTFENLQTLCRSCNSKKKAKV